MSYYAKGDGDAVLKKGLTENELETLKKAIEECQEDVDGDIDILGPDENGKMTVIWWESDDHWHEEYTTRLLDALAPYVESGIATYIGEDDCYFGYKFDALTNSWRSIEGILVYDNDLSAFSDEALIKALELRGYTISKKEGL